MTSASLGANLASGELAVLSQLVFELRDAATVLGQAAAAVPRLGPCQTEATYLRIAESWQLSPSGQGVRPDIDQLVAESGGSGSVEIPGRPWGWVFPLRHQGGVEGALVVSAADHPSHEHIQLLTVLANETGAALAAVRLRRQDEQSAEELAKMTSDLVGARQRLRSRTHAYETIEAALTGADGDLAIVEALHELTGLPVALEDRFGNLRRWSGPGRPEHYPKPDPQRRQRQLSVLAARRGPMRLKDRIAALLVSRGETLGVLAIVDPREQVTEDDKIAMQFACTLLSYELSHQRRLVELEQSIRQELVDDLLAGTAGEGAIARAEALGHDLRGPHYVVVVHSSAGLGSVVAAAGRTAAALQLNTLQGRSGQLVVLLTAGRPDLRALHRKLSELLSPATCAVGVGSRSEKPSELPQSFAEAKRALNVRMHSAAPAGASAYDELGFYRLIDVAHACGAVDDFIREWLGALLEYDEAKKSELVLTLSQHLENGGSYDESAKALHIHRSTLRYRLARISELTGYDLHDVDTRFNLHAAARAWRFLHADSVHLTGSP
ncbi:PucR family transcriptional regulator [Mycolicibacterium sp. 120270]|uniref:PucR family transcriptional regulator n=1 Tax=Mycolicibacterium sp. 120270 TaxID=3090600 RepID=UPI00299EEB84|nr:helix-turn-helix domain-containing protein [Mycolicibacterium sp. 120270]MDX1883862.1 helix-turn-helix domain-containing protein [Mycolicibacterium sp. 120270]